MIKVGEKAKGFRFGSDFGLSYFNEMDSFVDVEGEIVEIYDDRFLVKFPQIVNSGIPEEQGSHELRYSDLGEDVWWYPIAEYLRIQREERLKEIGL